MNGIIAFVFWIVYMIVVVGSTVIVAVLISNWLNLNGVSWWAVVIVTILILNSLIRGFKVKSSD